MRFGDSAKRVAIAFGGSHFGALVFGSHTTIVITLEKDGLTTNVKPRCQSKMEMASWALSLCMFHVKHAPPDDTHIDAQLVPELHTYCHALQCRSTNNRYRLA